MKNIQIKIGGFGGQGIVLAGYILGKAASIHDQKNATLTQSYGPESRGSSCSAQLIIGKDEIDYPKVSHPDILMIMSQEAYDKFTPELARGGHSCMMKTWQNQPITSVRQQRYTPSRPQGMLKSSGKKLWRTSSCWAFSQP